MSSAETKTCQNCKASFTIDASDFQFYEKIKVPPPTFCQECRLQRRMVLRNERVLYKDECDLCKKSFISLFSPEKPFTVYCRECWYGDGWDPFEYGVGYNWNEPFFEQYRKLMRRVPRLGIFHYYANVNVDYANFIASGKNIYLSYSVVESENIYYSRSIDRSNDCFDCFQGNSLERCYENIDGARNYTSLFLLRSRDCLNSSFLFDCANCQHCFMSANFRNKQFVFRNRQCTKQEYEAEMRKINLGSAVELARFKDEFSKIIRGALHKYANLIKTSYSTGDNLENCKNVRHSFDVYGSEDLKFCTRVVDAGKDGYDVIGGLGSELQYEGNAPGKASYNVKFFNYLDAARDIFYCDWCHGSSNLFGCSGLRKKSYCILNKQYDKEEYSALVAKILKHMDEVPYKGKNGQEYKFGELFPTEHSLWAYNETVAQEYFPLTKEEALKKGYAWRDPDPYPHKPTVMPKDLPDDIKDAPDSIVNEVIGCPDCGRAYRIINPELEFLRHEKIALPRKCPDCRHKDRFALRNPLKLWRRKCTCAGGVSENSTHQNTVQHFHGEGHCQNEFETSYAPERNEAVYCEACYQQEVV